jgi:hypothetical protein
MIGSPLASGSRLLGLTTAVLLAGAVYGGGKLQAHEGPGDSYRLDRIREVGSPVGSPSTSDSRQIQQSLAAAFPRTGFEQRNGSSWTTLTEEQRFLSELDTASDRVRVSVLGRTLQERPIQLVVAGPPLTNSQIKTRGAILFVCTQHGLEPAGREACLQLARNHAASASTTTLLIIPTANPDGVAANTRENSTGADINRDHVRLDTREARVISRVLRDFRPPLVSDMHEYKTAGARAVLLKNRSFFPNTDSAIIKQISDANNLYLIPDLNAAGFATGFYDDPDSQSYTPSMLTRMGPLRHATTVLIETPRMGTLSPLQRVGAQLKTTGALLRMWNARRSALMSTSNDAALRAVEEGAAGNARYHFTHAIYTDQPPCGYQLSTTQYDRSKPRLDLFGIRASAQGGGWSISMAQRAQPFIGLLLDSRATEELTAGQPLPCP